MSSIDDKSDFETVSRALKVMEMNVEEQEALFQLVAVVIHLGNVEFVANAGRAKLENPQLVATIAQVFFSFRFHEHIPRLSWSYQFIAGIDLL